MMGFKSLTTHQPFGVISYIYCSTIYQLPFILTAALPDKRGLSHGMCLYQAPPMTVNRQKKNRSLCHTCFR